MRNLNWNAFPLTSGTCARILQTVKSIDPAAEGVVQGPGNTATHGLLNDGNVCHGGIEMEQPGSSMSAVRRLILKTILFPVAFLVLVASVALAESTMIRDEYWGGNTKIQKDSLGRASEITGMEVVADDERITVTISGPFFYNYVHHLKGADKTPPGDLYISSAGWKVKGSAPYAEDTFTKDEGWDYVVSLFDKAVYKLDWSKIEWTRPKPGSVIYRRDQAWRGGYGEFVSWADVKLTDKALVISFPFTALLQDMTPTEAADGVEDTDSGDGVGETAAEDQNMLDIGLHWTMMCGNDIVEGAFALPATIYSDYEEAETMILPRPTPYLVSGPPDLVGWSRGFAWGTFPYLRLSSDRDHDYDPPKPPHKTPEPSTVLLLAGGLSALGFVRRTRKK